jgi:hypothetical protein
MSLKAYNSLYGLNEGNSDVMAVALTGDPDFMAHSIDKNGPYKIVRDARDEIYYTQQMDFNAQTGNPGEFDPYEIASFVSALFYYTECLIDGIVVSGIKIPSKKTRHSVAHVQFLTLEKLGKSISVNFELWDFFNIYINTAEPEIKNNFCKALKQRYAIHYDRIKGCQN